MPEFSDREATFLNGWIGERLAALWLELKGYEVVTSTPQRRGTEKATSSGDIDLIAKKGDEIIYAEVKCWSKKSSLTPSWLVQFMLERNKLNTLFEQHSNATHHMLIFGHPASGTFKYPNNSKYVEQLIYDYGIPQDFLRNMAGQTTTKFVEGILKFLVHNNNKDVVFSVVYFKQIIEELRQMDILDSCRSLIEEELSAYGKIALENVLDRFNYGIKLKNHD